MCGTNEKSSEQLTIGTVSERSGLAASAVRYYEDQGLITSERTEGGQRRDPREVLRRLAFVRAAQRVGLSLDEIKTAFASLPTHKAPNKKDWQQLTATWRPMLEDRIRVLEKLRDRVNDCIGCGCLSMENCSLMNPGDELAEEGPGAYFLSQGRHRRG